jgi:hypothetical protein
MAEAAQFISLEGRSEPGRLGEACKTLARSLVRLFGIVEDRDFAGRLDLDFECDVPAAAGGGVVGVGAVGGGVGAVGGGVGV